MGGWGVVSAVVIQGGDKRKEREALVWQRCRGRVGGWRNNNAGQSKLRSAVEVARSGSFGLWGLVRRACGGRSGVLSGNCASRSCGGGTEE